MAEIITHPLIVAAYTVVLASVAPVLIAARRSRRRRDRQVEELVSELQTHVIPHFRPATPVEIREGHRSYGDTLPERTTVVERNVIAQSKALSVHLDAEMLETTQVKDRLGGVESETSEIKHRLGRLERHLQVPGADSPMED